MRKVFFIIGLVIVALWFSFYTENLTERKRREEMKELKPEQLVSRLMTDSLAALEGRAISLEELVIHAGEADFAQRHGRLLGIGSPTFYVVKGECDQAQVVNDEIHASVNGIALTIPLKYIFGNTARDASGWFDIDDFQNTMDFNAVSAAMNDYILKNMTPPHSDRRLKVLGAVAVKDGQVEQSVTIIPYQLLQ